MSLFPVCPMLSVSVFSIIDCHCFLCAQCCLCLCIVHYWLWLFPVCPMLCVSLYSLLLIVTVSCVPNVVCVSVLSIIDCDCFLCAQSCLGLCILYYWLSLFPLQWRDFKLFLVSCTLRVRVMVFNSTFNNISALSWWSILLVEETQRVLREIQCALWE